MSDTEESGTEFGAAETQYVVRWIGNSGEMQEEVFAGDDFVNADQLARNLHVPVWKRKARFTDLRELDRSS